MIAAHAAVPVIGLGGGGGTSIHNREGIRYRFPVMAVTDNGRPSHPGVMDSEGSMEAKHQAIMFESYSNKRQLQSLSQCL